jgi:tRNA(fMet)-specific endonuclease VapC
MRYLLDTNICIFIMNRRPPSVREKFASLDIHLMAISSITLFELDSGFRKGARAKENLERLSQFKAQVEVAAFDALAAEKASQLRQYLREQGTPIGDMDLLISGHALALDAVVVTNSVREFERVPGLVMEDWLG